MPELTITSPYVHSKSRLQHIYHWQHYARVDLNPMPESTLSPSQGLWIWPLNKLFIPMSDVLCLQRQIAMVLLHNCRFCNRWIIERYCLPNSRNVSYDAIILQLFMKKDESNKKCKVFIIIWIVSVFYKGIACRIKIRFVIQPLQNSSSTIYHWTILGLNT